MDAMAMVLRKCREHSVMAFVFANHAEYAKPLMQAGWGMIAIGTDAGWFSLAAEKTLSQSRA
jgi:hypothetical protein